MFKLFQGIIFFCVLMTFSAYSSQEYLESNETFDHVYILRRHYGSPISTLEKIKEQLHLKKICPEKIMGIRVHNCVLITQYEQKTNIHSNQNNEDFSLNNIQMTYGIPFKMNKFNPSEDFLKISCMATVAVVNALKEENIQALIGWKYNIIIGQQDAGEVGVDFSKDDLIFISVNLNNIAGLQRLNSLKGNSNGKFNQPNLTESLLKKISQNLYNFFIFPDYLQDNIDKSFARYNDLLASKDQKIKIVEDNGQTTTGIYRGIDIKGRLLLQNETEIKSFAEGKITLN